MASNLFKYLGTVFKYRRNADSYYVLYSLRLENIGDD